MKIHPLGTLRVFIISIVMLWWLGAEIVLNKEKKILVNNKSSVNIIFGSTFDQMECIDLLEKISLLEGDITISFILYTKPKTIQVFLDFLVVNRSSTYNAELTSMWYITMKFPIEARVAMVKRINFSQSYLASSQIVSCGGHRNSEVVMGLRHL